MEEKRRDEVVFYNSYPHSRQPSESWQAYFSLHASVPLTTFFTLRREERRREKGGRENKERDGGRKEDKGRWGRGGVGGEGEGRR